MAARNRARIVITGLGVVSPVGIGKDAFWASLQQNHSGIDYLSIPHDGLPSAFVFTVTQTPDGFIWASTLTGVARCDGRRFTATAPGRAFMKTRRSDVVLSFETAR